MILPFLLAAAAPQVAAKPTGPWVVNVDENMCLLERNYPVEKAGPAVLIFQPMLDLPTMELFVQTQDRSDRQYVGQFTVRVEPGARTYTGKYFSAGLPKDDRRLTRLSIERAALDDLKDGDTLFVNARPIKLAFAIARPEKARPALATCVADLKKSWGIDEERDARAVIALDGDPARYFGPEAYPVEAYRQGIYGRVVALLNIDPTGAVANCRIVSSAGKLLNEGTCTAAKRIRFKPPRGADGQPFATTYLLPVRWVLPGSPQ